MQEEEEDEEEEEKEEEVTVTNKYEYVSQDHLFKQQVMRKWEHVQLFQIRVLFHVQ